MYKMYIHIYTQIINIYLDPPFGCQISAPNGLFLVGFLSLKFQTHVSASSHVSDGRNFHPKDLAQRGVRIDILANLPGAVLRGVADFSVGLVDGRCCVQLEKNIWKVSILSG